MANPLFRDKNADFPGWRLQIASLRRYTGAMDFKAAFKNLIFAVAAGSFALSALAQWQWLDKDGRKVFSDRSPPAEIKDKDILRRPPGSLRPMAEPEATAVVPVAGAASAPAVKASSPKLSGKDPQLEARKKLADEAEASKKKAEDEKIASTKSENCERSKANLAALQSGVRMAALNAKGEREVFDDAKRASETKRAQEAIDTNCK